MSCAGYSREATVPGPQSACNFSLSLSFLFLCFPSFLLFFLPSFFSLFSSLNFGFSDNYRHGSCKKSHREIPCVRCSFSPGLRNCSTTSEPGYWYRQGTEHPRIPSPGGLLRMSFCCHTHIRFPSSLRSNPWQPLISVSRSLQFQECHMNGILQSVT